MLIIKNDIKDYKYDDLLSYMTLRCDTFTFVVPDFETNSPAGFRSNDFIEYKKRINWRLDALKPYIIKVYNDKDYFGNWQDYYQEIYVVQFNEFSKGCLASSSLYSWKYPELPEDLCFFSKGKCFLRSVAHEEMCWIFPDHDIEKDILKKVIGLKFYEREDIEAPLLNL